MSDFTKKSVAIVAGATLAAAAAYCAITKLMNKKTEISVTHEESVPASQDIAQISAELEQAVEQWLEYCPDAESKHRVASLYAAGDFATLQNMFIPRISFGTAGLRAKMDDGYKHMNTLVVMQTTQGLCEYLLNTVPDAKERGVILGYDGRYNSKSFAETAAAVLISRGVKVFLFNDYVCTPMVPFGVEHKRAAAGIMVTASHNPKQDNGYKVYWSNGAQIIPPTDVGIANEISKNLKPWKNYTFDAESSLLEDATVEITEAYFAAIMPDCCFKKDQNPSSELKVTYTAMHGVGAKFVTRAFAEFGLPPFVPTEAQLLPDPEFSTVTFPNPEEGKGALKLAMEAADASGSDLILANDPDADRLAVAVRDPSTGSWVILTGNEIAAVLADWTWLQWRAANPTADPQQCVMLASTVSSKHLQAMANKEGFQFRDTLTGFKWIGNAARSAVHDEGLTCLVAYEVEIGFIIGHASFDKDGVRTAAAMAELASHWHRQGETLLDRVRRFYSTYGHFKMTNSYFFCHEAAALEAVFAALRANTEDDAIISHDGLARFPGHVGEFAIASVRDVSLGYNTKFADGRLRLPQVKDSHMITFTLENGATATMRNSGTEPKLKFYVECSSVESPEVAQQQLEKITAALIKDFIQPEKHGLIAKKD